MNGGERRFASRKCVWPSPAIIDTGGFTLIELLVVIAVVALLLAIFIPALGAARERGQRAVCLSNLRQLTVAWIAYADAHDSRLVSGNAFGLAIGSGRWRLEGWVGRAFLYPKSRTALIENPAKGPLWPYLRDIDIYRCPRGRAGHVITYATVVSANNNTQVEGTCLPDYPGDEMTRPGVRVGATTLKLTRFTDIVSPGASQRAVFVDQGQTPTSGDYYVHYLYPKWKYFSVPPIRHADGVTLSLADGHAEYWKWKGRETVQMPRELFPGRDTFSELLAGWEDYAVQTEEGLYDLQRLQRATWGRLGYPAEEAP